MKLHSGSETQAGIYVGTATKIESRIKEWIAEDYTTMAQYFAARNGVVFLDGAQGRCGFDSGEALLATDSIFPVSSITKSFTGALIMILTEDGILSPNDFVYRHIPEFDGEGKKWVQIAHLLTHTSGINNNVENNENIKIPESINTDIELRRYLYAACHAPNLCEPGIKMSYSSLGLMLVGEIIERATGRLLPDIVHERLFRPLNMENTFLGAPDSIIDRIVHYPKSAYFDMNIRNRHRYSASSGAFSNARDLSIFGQMLLNKGEYNGVRLLSRLSVEAMTRNQIPGISAFHDGVQFSEAGWGYSLMLSLDKFDETGTLRSYKSFGHSGAGCSMFICDPVNGVVASLLCSTLKKEGDSHFERRFDRFFNMVMSGVV